MGCLLRSVFGKTLWDQWRTWLWWGLGLLAVVLVYVAPFDQYREAGVLDVETDLPLYEALGFAELATPEGYLQATLFGLLGPLLVIMAAVVAGARAIAGDEEARTLDLLLAQPVSRTRVVVERFAALAAALAGLGLVVWASATGAAGAADMGIGADRLAAAVVGLMLLGLVFGALALAVGGFSGRRGMVLGTTAAVAVATYLANNLAPRLDALEPVQRISPFYYALGGDPLRTGFTVVHLAVLVAMAAALLGVAVWAFNRRDIAV